MRINKYIASCGVCSRRKADELVKEGQVKINDNIIRDLSYVVKSNDIVRVKDGVISLEEKNIYLMLNKPKGILSSVSDDRGRKTIVDIISEKYAERLYPVGRLDYDTEGLIIITNDGDFFNKVIHPKSDIYKTYEVIINNFIDDEIINKMKKSIKIDDYVVRNSIIIRDKNNKNKFIVKIKEGKNRQVKKMFSSVGSKVIHLKRIAIGEIKLGNLEIGKFRELTNDEIKYFLNTTSNC